MRILKRFNKPRILEEKENQWTQKYFENRERNARPSSNQYAHPEIKNVLMAMSFQKCFYCETKLSESEAEVDHYIEVAIQPELAFSWHNLYLSCPSCNEKKISHSSIPTTTCIDPCNETGCPEEHLFFDDEFIKSHTDTGKRTIQKYRLDREELDHKRIRQIKRFQQNLLEILLQRMVKDGRKTFDDDEKEILRHFAAPDHPYSLMFSFLLRRFDLV